MVLNNNPSDTEEAPLTLLESLRKTLPQQVPLEIYAHRNTLHAFEHLNFHDALKLNNQNLKLKPYLKVSEYQDAFTNKRITPQSIERSMEEWYSAKETSDEKTIIVDELTDGMLRKLCLTYPLSVENSNSIEWFLFEGDGLTKSINPEADFSPEQLTAMWYASVEKTQYYQPVKQTKTTLDWELKEGVKSIIDRYMISFLVPYTDQGLSYWPFPHNAKKEGFRDHFLSHLNNAGYISPLWMDGVHQNLEHYSKISAEEMFTELVKSICPKASHWETFLRKELYELKGWAAFINQVENNPSILTVRKIKINLIDYMACRLLLLKCMLRFKVNYIRSPKPTPLKFALNLFLYAQVRNHSKIDILNMTGGEVTKILDFINNFPEIEQQRIWHRAYEISYRDKMLSSLYKHAVSVKKEQHKDIKASYQIFFCLDDREESIRRYVEFLDPNIQTFGAPGFFGVPMRYRRIRGASAHAHCPVVVKPSFYIEEIPKIELREEAKKTYRKISFVKGISRSIFINTKTTFFAFLLSLIGGLSTLIPLGARVLMPRLSQRLWKSFKIYINPHFQTKLKILKEDDGLFEGIPKGLTHEQMADCVSNILKACGLTENFAKIVVMMGHSSNSQNNPHLAAYNCLACGGNSGGANARAYVQMANTPEVRAILKIRGIEIPTETHFTAANHETCADFFYFYDMDEVPVEHRSLIDKLQTIIDLAGKYNALERVRRFAIKPEGLTIETAKHHVEARSESIDEPRAELGHATNALCIIGRRDLSKNLFLDRRALLVSYDPNSDLEGNILANICAAAIPISSGISLDYYFSRVDPTLFGTGSKLPHNVTGMIGIMNGQMSDLLMGMPWQSVELHEPMRMLFIIESYPAVLDTIMSKNQQVANLVKNEWCQVVLINPDNAEMLIFERGNYVPFTPENIHIPNVENWYEHFKGRSDNLSVAVLQHVKARS